jgi:hypothetical protein
MDEEEYLFCFLDIGSKCFSALAFTVFVVYYLFYCIFLCYFCSTISFFVDGQNTNPRTVILDYEVKNEEHDQAQKDILQKQNLDPLELKAKLLEVKSKDISSDFEYMRDREHTHRDTNESTNERTTWMMASSLGLLALLAVGQHFYLKRYFKSHKVI